MNSAPINEENQQKQSQDLLQQILKFPKIDLHRHLDGSLFPQDLFRIVSELNIELTDQTSMQSFNEAYNYTHDKRIKSYDIFVESWEGAGYDEQNDEKKFYQILSRFAPIIAVMQYKEGLYQVCKQVALDLVKENIFYAEFRFAPIFHIAKEIPNQQEVFEIVWGAFQEIAQKHDIVIKIIACLPSFEPLEKGLELVDECVKFNLKYSNSIVAIDVACGEDKFPPITFKKMYEKAKQAGLKTTIHCGEIKVSDDQTVRKNAIKNISDSILELQADGLGHAILLPELNDLLAIVKEKKIRVESNPISNKTVSLIRSFKDLKLDILLANKVLTINSDDCAMWKNGSLTENIAEVFVDYQWNLKELEQIQRNALNLSFSTDEEKKKMTKIFEAKLIEFNKQFQHTGKQL